MGPIIRMSCGVSFDGHGVVWVDRKKAISATSEQIGDAVKLAASHSDDLLLKAAACGGGGPFSGYSDLEYSEYIRLKQKFELDERIKTASKVAKFEHVRIRRNEFRRSRSDLYLAMMSNGIPYKCFVSDCFEVENLTIDHKIPLSRGGSNELTNLQFSCRSHNSIKSDKVSFKKKD